jgi:hypothetical protein
MKRFVMTGALVTAVLLTAAQPAAASWLQKSTPVPSGASTWSFSAVSCPSGLWCMAVGTTQSRLLAETRVGGTWTEVSIPDPGGGQLAGLSCTSTSFCEAVGSSSSGGAAVPSGSVSEFSSVSCSLVSRCVAVGFVTRGGVSLPLGEFWNGTTWAVAPTQQPDLNVTRSTMSSVSCATSLSCMGVGFYDASGGVEAPVGEQFS